MKYLRRKMIHISVQEIALLQISFANCYDDMHCVTMCTCIYIYIFHLFFIFIFIFIMFNTTWNVSKYGDFSGPNAGKYGPKKTPYLDTFHAESSYEYRHTCSFAHMSYCFWMITWMKNVNNFQIAKVQPRGVALHQVQPGVAYKSVAYKKVCILSHQKL